MKRDEYIARYRKQGKSEAWIAAWLRKWNEVGEKLAKREKRRNGRTDRI